MSAATMIVHWPSGPVALCDAHGAALLGIAKFLGEHVIATMIEEPTECVSCRNEPGGHLRHLSKTVEEVMKKHGNH